MLVRKTIESDLEHVAIIMDGNGRWAKNRGRRKAFWSSGWCKKSKRNCGKLPRFRYKVSNNFAFSTKTGDEHN